MQTGEKRKRALVPASSSSMPSGRREIDLENWTDKRHPSVEEYEGILKQPEESYGSKRLRGRLGTYRFNEGKKMRVAEAESRLANLCLEKARPPPKFEMGQSVHHFWASWMHTARKVPQQISKKTGRPHWYSALIASAPIWETVRYGGISIEGWTYHAY